ncbi:MAG: V-type ATP synthase subunit E family protein [Hadesarchaea archaeon]|nr:V-type ATP synthase subunit E family protein [Hadesarchaea archaeon]MDH5685022.1 V-type ATP synthase subunit E family protein [Hadesarchaea archaeon]
MPAEKGAQLIADDIINEAKEKAADIVRRAKKEARALLDAARFGAKEEMGHEMKEARAQGKHVYDGVLAEGRMKAKREMLQKREELINEVFREAEKKLQAQTSSKKYEEDLIHITVGAYKKLGSEKVIIRANRRDLKLLEKSKDTITRELGGGERAVNISFGEPIQTIGGVRVGTPDGKIEIDETFEGKMRREFETLRVKIAKVLFEGSK